MVGPRQWQCGPPCTREFSDSAGLGRHHRACEYYKHRLDLQAQNFKRASEDPKPARAFKKMKPCPPSDAAIQIIPSREPEPSTGSDMPIDHTPSAPNQLHAAAPSPSHDVTVDHTMNSSDSPSVPSDFADCSRNESRQSRQRRLPLRYRDELPEPPPPVSQDPPASLPTHVILHVFDSIRMCFNKFGIAREYRHRPSYDPDEFVSATQLSNIYPCDLGADGVPDGEALSGYPSPRQPPWPWKNTSIWRLMSWMMTGSSQKSQAEVTRLVKDVLQADDFNIHDLKHFDAHTEMRRFDAAEDSAPKTSLLEGDGWSKLMWRLWFPQRRRIATGMGVRSLYPVSSTGRS
ncbi:hypothetical protein EDD22DRAFT_961842 [Suillus occidentalis]|nr:hypothetical protein EDD22DRAFT_961842 [Suillus occidentalis]